jgi:hypothetical protein
MDSPALRATATAAPQDRTFGYETRLTVATNVG